jgi:hypothetical protein
MVMGIIGYTQGVSEVRNPAVRAKAKACKVPRLAAAAKSPALAVDGIESAARTTAKFASAREMRRDRPRKNTTHWI